MQHANTSEHRRSASPGSLVSAPAALQLHFTSHSSLGFFQRTCLQQHAAILYISVLEHPIQETRSASAAAARLIAKDRRQQNSRFTSRNLVTVQVSCLFRQGSCTHLFHTVITVTAGKPVCHCASTRPVWYRYWLYCCGSLLHMAEQQSLSCDCYEQIANGPFLTLYVKRYE